MRPTQFLRAVQSPRLRVVRHAQDTTMKDRLAKLNELVPPQPLLQSAYKSKFVPVQPEVATQILTRVVSQTNVDVSSVCRDFSIPPQTLVLLSILLLRSPPLPTHLQKLRLQTSLSILTSTTFTRSPSPLAAKELHRLLHNTGTQAQYIQALIPPARQQELSGILRDIATEKSDIEAAKLYAQSILASPAPTSRQVAAAFLEGILPRLEEAAEKAEKEKGNPESIDLTTTPGKKGLGEIFTLLAQSLGQKETHKKVMYLSKAAGLFQNPAAYWELALMWRPEVGERHRSWGDVVPGYPAEGEEGWEEDPEMDMRKGKKGKKVDEKPVVEGKDGEVQEGTARATAYIRNLIKAAALGKKEAAGLIAGYYVGIGMKKEAGEWAALALKAKVPILDAEGKECSLEGIKLPE
ncbi:hypothetical protein BJ508DRAFT_415117 [Ascobolus immersus RN42]|uniref:Uncharacterized protein n=1 Tax=Ascobolus immersus RN42 TaxID=1160509 RepID=A0A3N4I402_ASCIM|nr:hypothetical protein BJ508DRAFT_415117 [Ascobolus immersus RN42]